MSNSFVTYIEQTLKECQYLVDMYMIDYFVEDLWHQILPSWQNFYESHLLSIDSDRKAVVDLVKHILRRPNEPLFVQFNSPEPLSMLALKAVISNIELKQWQIPNYPQEILPKIELSDESKPTAFTNLRHSLPPALRIKIKNKKEHEVSRISDVAKILINKLGPIDEIVDVGAGIGHLSRILSLLLEKKVSTIEGDPLLVETANKLDERIAKNLKYLSKRNKIEKSGEWNSPDRKALYIEEEKQMGDSEGKRLLLTGLHTCGDFSATILKYFCANDDARILLHFGCCYHKLNNAGDKLFKDIYEGKENNVTTKGYPLSQAFSHLKLTYAAREVACFGHEQFIAKLNESIGKKLFFVNCYRAIVEWILLDCPKPSETYLLDGTLRHQGLRGFRGAEEMDFLQYADEALRDKPAMKEKFYQIVRFLVLN
uniref:Methyltransferase domain-containing protein n=1 Tax=Panagrolaimus sp. ES5 TaxID=591445 RepID=A0AC34F7A0_9BILA